jgi:hypothetical protein
LKRFIMKDVPCDTLLMTFGFDEEWLDLIVKLDQQSYYKMVEKLEVSI